MTLRVRHCGDVHLEEDRYFGDTDRCLEWFLYDGIRQKTDLLGIDGDLTTYKATIKERNLWIDTVIRMAEHALALIVSGNHGEESNGALYALAKAKGKHNVYLSTEPELIEFDHVAIATFPYPRKADWVGTPREEGMQEAFVEQMDEFNRQFVRRPGYYRLFFGHFGVAGARMSSGQPLAGPCAEYPLDTGPAPRRTVYRVEPHWLSYFAGKKNAEGKAIQRKLVGVSSTCVAGSPDVQFAYFALGGFWSPWVAKRISMEVFLGKTMLLPRARMCV